MSNIDWRDGGDKPLARADTCVVCGGSIFAQTRDYFYGKDGEQWVRAHKACVPTTQRDPDDSVYLLCDSLINVEKEIKKMNGWLEMIAARMVT